MRIKAYNLYSINHEGIKYFESAMECVSFYSEKIMFISRGISGSGKSTAIANILKKDLIFSTDDFWGPNYDFNNDRLKEAHDWNRQRVEHKIASGFKFIGVDNTNLSYFSILPYLNIAKKYNYNVVFVESILPKWLEFKMSRHLDGEDKKILSDLFDFFAENNTHKVPRDTIKGQAFSYDDENDLSKILKNDVPISNIYKEDITNLLNYAGYGEHLEMFIRGLDREDKLKNILPEVYNLKGFEHNPIHHPEGDAYEHTLMAVKNSRSTDPITNIAVLLHDIGKALTYKNRGSKEFPRHTYYSHERVGEKMIPIVCNRLGLSDEDCKQIRFTTLNHMHLHSHEYSLNPKSKILSDSPYWGILKDVGYADEMARGEELAQIGKFEERMKNFEKPVIIPSGAEKFTGAKLRELIPDISNELIGKVMMGLSALIKSTSLHLADIDGCSKAATDIYKKLMEEK